MFNNFIRRIDVAHERRKFVHIGNQNNNIMNKYYIRINYLKNKK